MAEAARREEKFQKEKRLIDLQIEKAERDAAEGIATEAAAREALVLDNEYDQYLERYGDEQRAWLERATMPDSKVSTDTIRRQLDDWNNDIDLADLEEARQDAERYAGAVADRHPHLADQVEKLRVQSEAGDITPAQYLQAVDDLDDQANLEIDAAASQQQAKAAADQLIADSAKDVDDSHPNYAAIKAILKDINSSLPFVKGPDGQMRVRPYKGLLADLEIELSPNLSESKQRSVQKAVDEALAEQANIEAENQLRAERQAQEEAELRELEAAQADADAYTVDGMEETALDAGGFQSQLPPGTNAPGGAKPKPLSKLKGQERKGALDKFEASVADIDTTGMSAEDFRAAVEAAAREAGINASYDELDAARGDADEDAGWRNRDKMKTQELKAYDYMVSLGIDDEAIWREASRLASTAGWSKAKKYLEDQK